MLHIINKPTHTRINFKADTDHQNFVYSSDRAWNILKEKSFYFPLAGQKTPEIKKQKVIQNA